MQNQARKRGIYLVANQHSGVACGNLIASIRRCGCHLPIRVIPYSGSPMDLDPRWDGVKLLTLADFPAEGLAFLKELEGAHPAMQSRPSAQISLLVRRV